MLLRAAAQALMKLAADPHEVGGLIGVLCVLHTWTRALVYHPHVHGLVPAGGVSAERTAWRPARQRDLVPVRALSTLFRGLFRDLAHKDGPDLAIPASVWTTAWVVYCQPAVHGTEQVLRS
jgi:putative transposase